MPFVQISLREGKSDAAVKAISDGIHEAMVATISAPREDRFQVITEHRAERIVVDPSYLGIARSGDVVIIRITMAAGRTVAQKKALYARIAANLSENPGVRVEDIMVIVTENGLADWSFGNGEAQFADKSFAEIRGSEV